MGEVDSKEKGGGQDGYTPLTLACLHKAHGFYYDPHIGIVKELLKRGADPTLGIVQSSSSLFRFGSGPMQSTLDIVREKMSEYTELIKILEDAAALQSEKMQSEDVSPGAPSSLNTSALSSGHLSSFSLGRQVHQH